MYINGVLDVNSVAGAGPLAPAEVFPQLFRLFYLASRIGSPFVASSTIFNPPMTDKFHDRYPIAATRHRLHHIDFDDMAWLGRQPLCAMV